MSTQDEDRGADAQSGGEAHPSALRVAFVPGVTITKWSRIWHERQPGVALEFLPGAESDQASVLHAGTGETAGLGGSGEAGVRGADVSFVRLPVETDGLSIIRLYDEVAVVVASADDPIAGVDELTLADLAGYAMHDTGSMDAADAVALVAAGVGAVILPHSVARLHSRKDVVARPVTDAPPTTISIAWLTTNTTAEIEDFVGIVRGRSARSSRANPTPPTAQAAKRAAQKAESARKADRKPAAAGKKTQDAVRKPRTAADDARAKRARVQKGRRRQGR